MCTGKAAKGGGGGGAPSPSPYLRPYFFSHRSLNLCYTLLLNDWKRLWPQNKNCWGKGRAATAANEEYRGKIVYLRFVTNSLEKSRRKLV